jgi:hypothetical protein
MQSCDMLYGITMPQRGVSKRVAVRFEEVGSDGKIAKAAQDRLDAEEARAAEALKPLSTGPAAPSPVIEVEPIEIDRLASPSKAIADAWE